VFQREIADCLARTGCRADVRYLPMGIHGDTANKARAAIQAAVDSADPQVHDVVLIGYGVCNCGVRGLVAGPLPLVLPRAYDCISLLLGSRQRYRDFFQDEPNTYFKTSGWVDAGEDASVTPLGAVASRLGIDHDLQSLVARYGEDNGRYVYETLQRRPYAQHVYVTTGCPDEHELIDRCRQQAQQVGCPLQVVHGTTRLLDALLQGPWDDNDFLVTPPGKQVEVVFDDRLLRWKVPSS